MTTEAKLDELDREYYRSKLEELSWCLPVVRAAKRVVWLLNSKEESDQLLGPDAVGKLHDAVEAYDKAMEGKS